MASGMSTTQAHKQFGFDNVLEHSKGMEVCINHALYICESVDKLAIMKERSVLASIGIQPDISSETESTDESTKSDKYSSEYAQN